MNRGVNVCMYVLGIVYMTSHSWPPWTFGGGGIRCRGEDFLLAYSKTRVQSHVLSQEGGRNN